MDADRLRRRLNAIARLCAFLLIVAGICAAFAFSNVSKQADYYLHAQECHSQVPSGPPNCYQMLTAHAVGATIDRSTFAHVLLQFDGSSPSLLDVQVIDTLPLRQLHSGDKVRVKVWGGVVTGLFLPPTPLSSHPVLRTPDNPLEGQAVDIVGAVSLIATGVVILLLLPAPLWVRRHIGRGVASQWFRTLDVRQVFHQRATRVAFLILLIAQLLDVETSIRGSSHGLREGNAVNAALIYHWGDVALIAVKIPATIVLLLAMARLPRRGAVGVAVLSSLATAAVVLSNLWLIRTHTSI